MALFSARTGGRRGKPSLLASAVFIIFNGCVIICHVAAVVAVVAVVDAAAGHTHIHTNTHTHTQTDTPSTWP